MIAVVKIQSVAIGVSPPCASLRRVVSEWMQSVSSYKRDIMDQAMDSVRPTLKLLNKYVKLFVTTKWYDLGIELLADEDVKALDEIQNNYPRDTSMCCTKMFQLWLDRQPKTSWRELLQALREPNIGLNELADTVEQELISINEGNSV